MKSSLKGNPFVFYDVVGGGLVLAIALFGLWTTFVHLPDSHARLERALKEKKDLKMALRAVEQNLNSSNIELAGGKGGNATGGATRKAGDGGAGGKAGLLGKAGTAGANGTATP